MFVAYYLSAGQPRNAQTAKFFVEIANIRAGHPFSAERAAPAPEQPEREHSETEAAAADSCPICRRRLLLRRKYDGDSPSAISFSTGPSRTGDIERILKHHHTIHTTHHGLAEPRQFQS
jgi:hypothetical protein